MIGNFIHRFGFTKTAILVTLVSVLLSVLVTAVVMYLSGATQQTSIGFSIAVIVPAFVAPVATYLFSKYLIQLEEAKEALTRYADELEVRNAELDAFAHTVAHDLKTPISVIVGYAEMLQEFSEQLSIEKKQTQLDAIAQNGYKMASIIDALLILSSIRNQGNVEAVPLNMREIIGEVIDRLDKRVTEQKANIIFPDEPCLTAVGYAPWIEEVWANYISNALKYGGQPPHIELGNIILPNGRIQFWVQDNGSGLSPTERASLFTPFERLHQTGNIEGHGLGLSIVKRIIEKLDGEVGVESNGVPGAGCRFYFTLPAANGELNSHNPSHLSTKS